MITRPFEIADRVKRPSTGFDFVPLLDIVVIVLFFGMFGSRFILAPGIAVDLELPAMTGAAHDALPTSRVITVGEVDGREMLMFEGRILDLGKFERFLSERAGQFSGEVLLVRMDRKLSMSLFARVLETAKSAGFAQVLLAAEPEPAAGGAGRSSF